MSDGDGATVYVDQLGIKLKIMDAGQRLQRMPHSILSDQCRLRLRPARCNALRRWHRTYTHECPVHAGRSALATTTAMGLGIVLVCLHSRGNVAAAPSLMPDALPAVTVPSALKAGF